METYYDILGVSENASLEEITHSYRTLIKIYHPDCPQGDRKKFKEIFDAYQVLSDPIKRKKYDDDLRKQREQDKRDNTDYNLVILDLIENIIKYNNLNKDEIIDVIELIKEYMIIVKSYIYPQNINKVVGSIYEVYNYFFCDYKKNYVHFGLLIIESIEKYGLEKGIDYYHNITKSIHPYEKELVREFVIDYSKKGIEFFYKTATQDEMLDNVLLNKIREKDERNKKYQKENKY